MTETACDTSVLVPALISWHPHHEICREAMMDGVTSVPAHVMLECYSVLTRLPGAHRVPAKDAGDAVAALALTPIALPATKYAAVVSVLGEAGIRGGAAYDGIVAATAQHHGRHLLTRDRRARSTYDVMGVAYTLLS